MKKLIDPYEIFDTWLPYELEGDYLTYLKQQVWITDGNEVVDYFYYKEVPHEVAMPNSNYSIMWYFSTKKMDEKNRPNPPTNT